MLIKIYDQKKMSQVKYKMDIIWIWLDMDNIAIELQMKS